MKKDKEKELSTSSMSSIELGIAVQGELNFIWRCVCVGGGGGGVLGVWGIYCNDPKFSDRLVWANSADTRLDCTKLNQF